LTVDILKGRRLALETRVIKSMNCCTFAGTWQGTVVAVKTMLFPAAMSGKEKREKMAIMETAISSTLSHPNIVQTYTYVVKPLTGELAMQVRVGRSQGPGKALGSAAREGGGSDVGILVGTRR
jgi:hypothetical protein